MSKTKLDKDERFYFFKDQNTSLHKASKNGDYEIVKYLIEKGADVNNSWSRMVLRHKISVFTLINNFNDPFYQRFEWQDDITELQINILIENGMI